MRRFGAQAAVRRPYRRARVRGAGLRATGLRARWAAGARHIEFGCGICRDYAINAKGCYLTRVKILGKL